MTTAQDFAKKYDMAATDQDVARIKGQIGAFYSDVERIAPMLNHYIQLHEGKAIRAAIGKRDSLYGAQGAVMAINEMPEIWGPQYRASVGYHLAPLLDEVVNS